MSTISSLRLGSFVVTLAGMCLASAVSRVEAAWVTAPQAPADAPNIVVVLLDDVGFGASSTFGGPIATPTLNRLADEGLRYNRFHTTGLCSPTRAALLSGRNHHQVGFGTVTEISGGGLGYNTFWPKSVATLPEMLRRHGYRTAAFGKWHNTPLWEISPAGPFDRWPAGLGFDYFYGFMGGESSMWEPAMYRNTTPVEHSPAPYYHMTTDIANDAIRWLNAQSALTQPYFLYFAPGATHAPHHVSAAWIERYRGKFDEGWDQMRADIFERQKRLGVIPADAVLNPLPKKLAAWNSLTGDQKRLYARQMEVYAAFLEQTDFEVGRVLSAVRSGPRGDNTLIFYIVGDNGPSAEGGTEGSDENIARFAGIPTELVDQMGHIDALGGPALDNHMATAWAYALSTPFQGVKTDAAHFGGTRNPLVVFWPKGIKDPGSLRTVFTHVIDIAPTIYDVLGIEMSEVVDGANQVPIEGRSFAGSFVHSTPSNPPRSQYFEIAGNRAIYQNGWMAGATHYWILGDFAPPGERFDSDRWELYHVEEDFSQARDLAKQYPEKLRDLKQLFDREARRNHVYPLQNPTMGTFTSVYAQPTVAGNRKEFVYPGDMPRMPVVSAVPKLNGSHRVSARVVVPDVGTSGVIIADGGRYGGFVLYVENGFLVYEHNFFGMETKVIRSESLLPLGSIEVGFELQRTDSQRWGSGIVRLFIDGKASGEGRLRRVGIPSPIDTFDIGADRGSPVSIHYVAPARFEGIVEDIRISLQ
ncbi:MAG: hypothetical protein CMLOHMNK_00544 [Steroidobacteraceae bacterium]|nr:hypothetical protein [Steroidobacteraceae bacterium]